MRARLAALNPAAPVIAAGDATVAQLIDCGLYDPERKIPDVKRWLAEEAYAHDHHHHHDVNRHDDRIRAFTLASDQAIPFSAFEMFLDLVRSMHGPNLLRVKGIVKLAETPGAAGGDPRRAARLPSAGDACRLAGRRPPHAAGVHRQRDTAARRSKTCSTPSSASRGPTSPTARR